MEEALGAALPFQLSNWTTGRQNDSPANEDTVRASIHTFVGHHRMFSCEPRRTAAPVVKIPSKVGVRRKAGGEERRKTEVH